MRTSDIRRVIDASLSGLKLSPQERDALLSRAVGERERPAPRRQPAKRLILAAAIAILALAIVVPAVGGQLHQASVEPTGDFMKMHFGQDENTGESFEASYIPEHIAEIWGEQFRNQLLEWKAQVLLPKWVPDGYRLDRAEVIANLCVRSTLRTDGSDTPIRLTVYVLPEGEEISTTVSVPSEPGSEETWEYGGISYAYSTNYERNTVVWTERNCAVTLAAPRDKGTMRKMIESIYE